MEVTRLKSTAEQLIAIQTRANQLPRRNFAVLIVLLHTGLRISELCRLTLAQYAEKHFTNVQRKGKGVTRKVFLSKAAREALDDYLDEERGRDPGPLFQTKDGNQLDRKRADTALRRIAKHANATLPAEEQIHLSAHVLRHTFLRTAAVDHGVQNAKELSGHASDQYIWRYVQPSDEEKAEAVEALSNRL